MSISCAPAPTSATPPCGWMKSHPADVEDDAGARRRVATVGVAAGPPEDANAVPSRPRDRLPHVHRRLAVDDRLRPRRVVASDLHDAIPVVARARRRDDRAVDLPSQRSQLRGSRRRGGDLRPDRADPEDAGREGRLAAPLEEVPPVQRAHSKSVAGWLARKPLMRKGRSAVGTASPTRKGRTP